MELAGRIREIQETEETILIVFQCCNQEVFDLCMSPAIKRPPVDTLVRVWTKRAVKKDDPKEILEVIIRWEDLDQ